jgi:hypothetical protein
MTSVSAAQRPESRQIFGPDVHSLSDVQPRQVCVEAPLVSQIGLGEVESQSAFPLHSTQVLLFAELQTPPSLHAVPASHWNP